MGKTAALQRQEEEYDEEYEYIDERPNLEPCERPTEERGDRPMRTPGPARWGPKRGRTR